MKAFSLLLLSLAMVVAYNDMNDNVLVKTMLSNKEMAHTETHEFVACMLDEGPCNGILKMGKNHVVDLMTDGCEECDKIQKKSALQFLKILKSDFPDMFEKFEAKYDPSRTQYDKVIKKLEKL